MLRCAAITVLTLTAAVGCTRDGADLVDHREWTELGAADDPFDDRPADVDCSSLAWALEDLGGSPSLEVDTSDCNYLTVATAAVADVQVGESMLLRMWHNDLVSPDDAETHAAVLIGGELVWEVRLPIPAGEGRPAAMEEATWDADVAVDEGAPIVFHLHNHGQNSYNLVDIARVGPE